MSENGDKFLVFGCSAGRFIIFGFSAANYLQQPDATNPDHKWVLFGTSGHRGTALRQIATFNENHILPPTSKVAQASAGGAC
ncbi:hypothetical protein OK016_04195 [Vibrio chagasii]|nr:hypothetical protein [Vibrio chagasii]